jgi:pyruvate dehydrogenase E1 component
VSQLDIERSEWLAALDDVVDRHGAESAAQLLAALTRRAAARGAAPEPALATPYLNTIAAGEQPRSPGDLKLERRIKSLIRWNAMAMVVRANREYPGIGGHISTYASAATLFEVGFNHFFRAPSDGEPGDVIYFQGHASPGVYARAFLEGRLSRGELRRFRREAGDEPGLSSYPHPELMPDFWQYPTVSMGLSPLMAIYQARFLRYLADRGLADTAKIRVWCFLGDGECDEPESLGSLALAGREQLDNLTFVVNCNLQRLDGPVRGNGKIIQELEAVFRGAGWNPIKVIWGEDWDPLIAADESGALARRMEEAVDGDYQMYSVADGATIREHFFGVSDELRSLVDHLSDDQIRRLRRGGHDPVKVYAAYAAAVAHRGAPSVVLAKTIKGYGLGEAGEGRNVTHQQKKLNADELRDFRARFAVPIGDSEIDEAPLYRPDPDSPELTYLRERRDELGGFVPARRDRAEPLEAADPDCFTEFFAGSDDREVSTTMALVRLLSRLLRDESVGERIVPIIPDEARTFGLDALFRRHGIYSHVGQRYEPVDVGSLMSYREATDGQILEEGITEAGAMSSFIAAGTARSTVGLEMLPFFIFYSMFGFQRIGDLIWAAGDSRASGFLFGATAGRTTLNGEGLQHADGHSQLIASAFPHVRAYDPAYAYELAVITRAGMEALREGGGPAIYYVTAYNESYPMPAMAEGAADGIVRGAHRVADCEGEPAVRLLGSGPILREVLEAAERLAGDGVSAEVYSVTSFSQLRREALAVERARRRGAKVEPSWIETLFGDGGAPFVAATDHVALVADQISRFLPAPMVSLGTDGFGRSDTREVLRRFFEVDAEAIREAAVEVIDRGRGERESEREMEVS